MRCWLPVAIGMIALFVSMSMSGIVAYLIIVAGFALVLDGATRAFERANRVGGMGHHRQ